MYASLEINACEVSPAWGRVDQRLSVCRSSDSAHATFVNEDRKIHFISDLGHPEKLKSWMHNLRWAASARTPLLMVGSRNGRTLWRDVLLTRRERPNGPRKGACPLLCSGRCATTCALTQTFRQKQPTLEQTFRPKKKTPDIWILTTNS